MPRETWKTTGIILRRHRYGETSLLIEWLTRDHGLVKTAARGAGRKNSGFPALDLYTFASLEIAPHPRGEIHTLKEASLIRPRTGLGLSYEKLLTAGVFGSWIEILLEKEHAEPAIHDLLAKALDWLETATPTRAGLFRFEERLCGILGWGGQDTDPKSPGARLSDACHKWPSGRRELLERMPV
jgi:DNA repair protein RecO (recombination protein O)